MKQLLVIVLGIGLATVACSKTEVAPVTTGKTTKVTHEKKIVDCNDGEVNCPECFACIPIGHNHHPERGSGQ